ncbi:LYR motif-containing protein 2 [Maniola jurtina]|uniref:LYR motif-containing protein 2 n=1 Tax=Maniola jurtina TaxID=191418 RepID=UPI001E68F67C|nr:LYR motif-containing protein 2 [Maniola jurtina]XP_045769340.1 LYR motif-containing protein 2 [Maniola jurtina]
MASKLTKKTLNLKQFLLRQEVLKLYREVFRTINKVPDESTRLELKEWARADFRNNKHHSDETAIKSMLHYGRKSLEDLKKSLALSDS